MSGIVAYAIRTCLGQALLGKTLAGDRIHDSAVEPLEEMIKPEPQPFIVISTDDEEAEPQGWELLDAKRAINIVVEVAIGGMTKVDLPGSEGGGPALRLDIPHTDEGLETTLNMVGRQIYREILGRRVVRPLPRHRLRPEQGYRAPRRQRGAGHALRGPAVRLHRRHHRGAGFRHGAGGPVRRLIALMEADTYLAKDVPLLRRMIAGDPLPDWHRAQVELGLTSRSYRALGLGPLFREAGEPVAQRFALNRRGRAPLVVQAEP